MMPAAAMSALQILRDDARVRPVVSEVSSLEAVREAHLGMQSGHSRGKTVVRP